MREKKGDAAAEVLRKQLLPKAKAAARATPKAAARAAPKPVPRATPGTKNLAARTSTGATPRAKAGGAGTRSMAPSGLPPVTVTRKKVPAPTPQQKQITSIDDLF